MLNLSQTHPNRITVAAISFFLSFCLQAHAAQPEMCLEKPEVISERLAQADDESGVGQNNQNGGSQGGGNQGGNDQGGNGFGGSEFGGGGFGIQKYNSQSIDFYAGNGGNYEFGSGQGGSDISLGGGEEGSSGGGSAGQGGGNNNGNGDLSTMSSLTAAGAIDLEDFSGLSAGGLAISPS